MKERMKHVGVAMAAMAMSASLAMPMVATAAESTGAADKMKRRHTMEYHFSYYLYRHGESLKRISKKEAEKEAMWLKIKKKLDEEVTVKNKKTQ